MSQIKLVVLSNPMAAEIDLGNVEGPIVEMYSNMSTDDEPPYQPWNDSSNF